MAKHTRQITITTKDKSEWENAVDEAGPFVIAAIGLLILMIICVVLSPYALVGFFIYQQRADFQRVKLLLFWGAFMASLEVLVVYLAVGMGFGLIQSATICSAALFVLIGAIPAFLYLRSVLEGYGFNFDSPPRRQTRTVVPQPRRRRPAVEQRRYTQIIDHEPV